tara:strand:+ start:52 stop:960 length:909 start_codon:yes stop_codon:yes gene_type:complete
MIIEILSTGIVAAIFTGIVSFLVFKLKFDFDKVLHQNEVASVKLETIINPLIYQLRMKQYELICSNTEITNNIESSGHLLTPELYNAILELLKLENEFGFTWDEHSDKESKPNIQYETYIQFRSQLLKKLTIEQSELSILANQNFENYRNIALLSPTEKRFRKLEELGKLMVGLVIIGLLLLSLFYNVANIEGIDKSNIWLNYGAVVVAIIGMLLCAFGAVAYIPAMFKPFIEISAMQKEHYRADQKVKETASYRCRVCDSIVPQYEGTWFTYCRHESSKKALKKMYVDYYWKKECDLETPH